MRTIKVTGKELKAHEAWLVNPSSGVRLNLVGTNLDGICLARRNLKNAIMREVNLDSADLSGADLTSANMVGASLVGAKLNNARLVETDFSIGDLSDADLSDSDLTDAKFKGVWMRGANLTGSTLYGCDFRYANLSGVKGIPTAREWLDQFEKTKEGIIVYKAIGGTFFDSPKSWVLEPGEYLCETPNPIRSIDCGSGVNFGTLAYVDKMFPGLATWKCLIEWMDLADVVVPYNTDGKARCARLKLLEKI